MLAGAGGNLSQLLNGLGVAIGGLQGSNQPLPGLGVLRMSRQDLAVDRVGGVRIVAQQVEVRDLQLEIDAGLAAVGDGLPDGALQKSLRHVKLVSLLVDGSQLGQEAGIGEGRFVSRGGHTLHVVDGLRILPHVVVRSDQSLPRGQIGGVLVQHLRVERGGLIVVLGIQQKAGVLELGVDLRRVPTGKWERQRLGEDALRFGIAALGLIDAGQGAQIIGVPGHFGSHRRGKLPHGGQRLLMVVGARVGQEKPAPAGLIVRDAPGAVARRRRRPAHSASP